MSDTVAKTDGGAMELKEMGGEKTKPEESTESSPEDATKGPTSAEEAESSSGSRDETRNSPDSEEASRRSSEDAPTEDDERRPLKLDADASEDVVAQEENDAEKPCTSQCITGNRAKPHKSVAFTPSTDFDRRRNAKRRRDPNAGYGTLRTAGRNRRRRPPTCFSEMKRNFIGWPLSKKILAILALAVTIVILLSFIAASAVIVAPEWQNLLSIFRFRRDVIPPKKPRN